mmetsp:Transcript_48430/g.113393  ORF Transcript_48430/g.113393 Transcript_48430/m.113393 type:complete len:200 (-) Transcript_48430:1444-2043(-)
MAYVLFDGVAETALVDVAVACQGASCKHEANNDEHFDRHVPSHERLELPGQGHQVIADAVYLKLKSGSQSLHAFRHQHLRYGWWRHANGDVFHGIDVHANVIVLVLYIDLHCDFLVCRNSHYSAFLTLLDPDQRSLLQIRLLRKVDEPKILHCTLQLFEGNLELTSSNRYRAGEVHQVLHAHYLSISGLHQPHQKCVHL